MSYANGVGTMQQVLSSITPATTATTESTNASDQRTASVTGTSSANHADQTSLSSVGGMIAHALEGSDVRSDKVGALQQAIASGTYHVSSADVADKIIHSLLE